jgi:hypothetical protein
VALRQLGTSGTEVPPPVDRLRGAPSHPWMPDASTHSLALHAQPFPALHGAPPGSAPVVARCSTGQQEAAGADNTNRLYRPHSILGEQRWPLRRWYGLMASQRSNPGPRFVQEHEMANTECAWWGICDLAARDGLTATDPCSGCATTVGPLARVAAATTDTPDVDNVPIGTSKRFIG